MRISVTPFCCSGQIRLDLGGKLFSKLMFMPVAVEEISHVGRGARVIKNVHYAVRKIDSFPDS